MGLPALKPGILGAVSVMSSHLKIGGLKWHSRENAAKKNVKRMRATNHMTIKSDFFS